MTTTKLCQQETLMLRLQRYDKVIPSAEVDLFLLSSFPSVVLHLPGVFWYQLVCRCVVFRTFYTDLPHPTENSVLLSASC
jgi:hypothetical protein